MTGPPTGVVSFLLTDVVGWTRLWEAHDAVMPRYSELHDRIVGNAIVNHRGTVFATGGDSYAAAFESPDDALAAALDLQLALRRQDWSEIGEFEVRAAVATGQAHERRGDYFGSPLNRAGRLRDAASGGQVLVAEATAIQADLSNLGEARLDLLGEFALRDVPTTETVYQLSHPELDNRGTINAITPARRAHTRFVGRTAEMAELTKLVGPGRIVTITGTGGVGKTRLAREFAASFERPSRFVDLQSAIDKESVLDAFTATLGLTTDPRMDPLDAIAAGLDREPILVVIDNCEQVITQAATVVERLLQDRTPATMLATSRRPLGLSSEMTFLVEPLPFHVDDAERPVSPSAELFIETASRVRPKLDLTRYRPTVDHICQQLEGLPLAIEIAASQLYGMSPIDIDSHLADRLGPITSRSTSTHPRQQSLESTIEWSVELLSDDERSLLGDLIVFRGGFTYASFFSVFGSEPSTVEGLMRLVEHSLVRLAFRDEEARYEILEMIREYVRNRLSESVSPSRRSRHADHYKRVAAACADDYRAEGQRQAILVMEREQANCIAALEWLFGSDGPAAAEMTNSMWEYWWLEGQLALTEQWIDRALRIEALGDTVLGSLHHGKALVKGATGNYLSALEHVETAIKHAERANDAHRLYLAQRTLGSVNFAQGNVAQADEAWERAGRLALKAGDQGSFAYAETVRVQSVLRLHGPEAALAQADAALEACRTVSQDTYLLGDALDGAALAALESGDWELAARHATEASRLAELNGFAVQLAWAKVMMGAAMRARGDSQTARRRFSEALDVFREVGAAEGVMLASIGIGHCLLDLGEGDPSLDLEATVRLALESERPLAPSAYEALARAQARTGSLEAARASLEAAAALRLDMGVQATPREADDRRRALELLA